ncbi:MAG: hypothetical protein Fur0035_18140 [Anaerolineales bacterium]
MKPNLQVFSNGFEGNWPSIEYAAWMAEAMQAKITLTGAPEKDEEKFPLEEIFSRAVSLFQQKGLDYTLELGAGPLEKLITHAAQKNSGTLFVFGPLGRSRLRRMTQGRSFRQIMAQVNAPLLYVPATRLPLKKVLICLGGLEYIVSVEHVGLKVAQMTGAAVTLLMVVPPVDLDYPEARVVRENWQNLAETDTLPGRTLREGLASAASLGVPASVKTRNGIIVEEILDEIKHGGYDLVCMGSPFSAHSLRQLFTPNVTAEVAEAAQTPILTMRFQG